MLSVKPETTAYRQMTCAAVWEGEMTDPKTDLHARTDEELEQELARVLAHARGEVLNDAEVQKFWLLNDEILRHRRLREASSGANG